MLNIAKTIREKRRARGYTQERLAQALGLTPAAVSKWETGQTLPDVTMLGPLRRCSASRRTSCWDSIPM